MLYDTTGPTVGLFTPASPQTREWCIALGITTATLSLGDRKFSAPLESYGTPIVYAVCHWPKRRYTAHEYNFIYLFSCLLVFIQVSIIWCSVHGLSLHTGRWTAPEQALSVYCSTSNLYQRAGNIVSMSKDFSKQKFILILVWTFVLFVDLLLNESYK